MSDDLRQRPGDQPLPRTANPAAPGMHDKAIKLLQQRRDLGLSRYGTTLQPFNGRDTRQDAEEEAADKFVYFLAYLEEQEQRSADAARQGALEALKLAAAKVNANLELADVHGNEDMAEGFARVLVLLHDLSCRIKSGEVPLS